ncbi:MAG: hypothetical protein JSR85_00840 [Proteobacteria bacterium]|nr:hypothetical protein [Pseudomonadota bacterium]
MINSIARKIKEQDVDSSINWLRDNTRLNVRQGLMHITSLNSLYGPHYDSQIGYLKSKLLGEVMFAESLFTIREGNVIVDDVVTIDASNFEPDIFDHHITSRPHFVKMIYQAMSYFPISLYEAYKEVTGENLRLDSLSEVREFYKSCSEFDSWTGHQLCAYISHCDPEAVDFISKNPQALDHMPDTRKARDFMLDNPEKLLPMRLSSIFPRADLYQKNLTLVKAAILGKVFEFIHHDRENWEQSTLKPQKGLEWAKKKGIGYHPVLEEYLFTSYIEPGISSPATSSGYTTPYLEMMGEVIRELEISRENQGKKEAIAALFAKKLADHKLTPPSQKLADAMATLVRLPESQQGRAKTKG